MPGKFFAYCLLVFSGLLFALNSMAAASEPLIKSVKEALENGQVAFIGRIISTHEIERETTQITGEANIEVHQCYYGISCKAVKHVKFRYVINTTVYRSFSVQFNVSDEVLFVLNKPLVSDSYFFSSDFETGFDFAYIIENTFPENYYDGSKIGFVNIYRRQLICSEEKEDIKKWTGKRAVELD